MNEPHNQKEGSIRIILARIEHECIVPKPRWHFLLREGVVISLGVFAVSVGALAVTAT